MLTLDEPSVLLDHGPLFFWAALALAALVGPLLAWITVRAVARRRAAAERERIGSPTGGLRADADGEVSVLSGVLELEGGGALVSAPLAGGGASQESSQAALRVGDTLVALEGELRVCVGSRERWGFSPLPSPAGDPARKAAQQPGNLLCAHRRWLASGQPARVRGALRIVPAAGQHQLTYREAALRHVLGPDGEQGRLELAAERPPRVRLSPRLFAVPLVLGALTFTGAGHVVGMVAEGKVREVREDGISSLDVASAEHALRWGALAAAVPFRRDQALSEVGWALNLTLLDRTPEREVVLLAASFERFRSGRCAEAVAWTEEKWSREATAELAETCADAASLRAASRARLDLGQLDRAADLASRAARLDPRRPPEQVALERTVYLMAGRLGPAAAALREMQSRASEFQDAALAPGEGMARAAASRGELGCAADQLAARAGDATARSRLQAAVASAASTPVVRGTCALLLADLIGGAERLALIDRIRRDPAVDDAVALPLLELEVDAARAPEARHPSEHYLNVSLPSLLIEGTWPSFRLSALEWATLDRLIAAADVPLAARRRRAQLAAELAPVASLLGDHARARSWADTVTRDWEVLGGHEHVRLGFMRVYIADRLDLLRAFVELRAGATPELPKRRAVGELAVADLNEGQWEVLADLLDLVARRDVAGFRELGGDARDDGWRAGLAIAARGSGDELAGWLERHPGAGRMVAYLGARRMTTGRAAMLAWLRRTTRDRQLDGLAARAIDAASLQKVAEALGDAQGAAEHRAVAEGLRRGLLRRETAAVRQVLGIE